MFTDEELKVLSTLIERRVKEYRKWFFATSNEKTREKCIKELNKCYSIARKLKIELEQED